MKVQHLGDPVILEHFRELADGVPAMAPLYLLAKQLSAKDYAAFLPAGISLDMLVIGDAIVVSYLSDIPAFQVRYQPRKTGKPDKYLGDIGMAERLIDSLALRFVIQERYSANA